MITINGYGSALRAPAANVAGVATVSAVIPKAPPASSAPKGVVDHLSSFSKQLSAAIVRAEQRDSSLTREQLQQKANALRSALAGSSYRLNKSVHDTEIPTSEDPDRRARAQAATAFMNGGGGNPFSGLSSEQLAAVAYDESGDFTVNERAAALQESYHQYSVWNQRIVAQLGEERGRTGTITESLKDILAYYKSMPAIELAQYSDDPIARTAQQMEEASPGAPTSTAKMLTLFELLSKQRLNPPDSSDEQQAADKAPLPSAGPQR